MGSNLPDVHFWLGWITAKIKSVKVVNGINVGLCEAFQSTTMTTMQSVTLNVFIIRDVLTYTG